MTLTIDSTQPDVDTIKTEALSADYPTGRRLLENIVQSLNEWQLDLHQIDNIQVETGPNATFTRTRNSVCIANAFAYALNCPVNNQPFEIPTYHQEPNIT
jgi:tRNA A37 threonylcarbamoyladenosine modification protein TsaB